jgi:hypothetical protein
MIEAIDDKLSAIEEAIATRLLPLQDDGLKIIGAPERQGPASKAELLFFFSGLDPQPTGAMVKPRQQLVTLQYTANLMVKDLRAHRAAYPFIQAIAVLLRGFIPPVADCTAFRFGGCSYRIVEQKEGLRWHYELTFSVETVMPTLKN